MINLRAKWHEKLLWHEQEFEGKKTYILMQLNENLNKSEWKRPINEYLC